MKTYHAFILSVVALSACRSRDDSTRLKDITPSIIDDSAGLELEINTNALASAKLKLSYSTGDLEMWSMLSDDIVQKKINPRITPFKLDGHLTIPASQLHSESQSIASNIIPGGFSFSGISGFQDGKKIETKEKNGRLIVLSKDLSAEFFDFCPTNFLSNDGYLASQIRKTPTPTPLVLESQKTGEPQITLTQVVYRPDGITWRGNCENLLSWNDINETKVMVILNFEIRLNSDKIIFPEAASDPQYPALTEGVLKTERDGKGTRFFKDYASTDLTKINIQRWNPNRPRIVINDTTESSGKPLKTTEQGRWVQEAIKIAVADLRMKVPPFGKKIALTSEQPRLSPDIAFFLGDAKGNAGLAMTLLDNKNGEIRQARIGIGEESKIMGRFKMLEGFAKFGMIEDPQRSFRDSFLVMVMHELGHTLGLRHNFDGYGMTGNWGNDLQSVMSYAMIGMPIEFVSDKIEWKPHDLLSLQILYSEVSGSDSRHRQTLIDEILKFPLSPDEMMSENLFGGLQEHLGKAIKYLETTNNPKVTKFRQGNTDWKNKIKAIYKEAYDVNLE